MPAFLEALTPLAWILLAGFTLVVVELVGLIIVYPLAKSLTGVGGFGFNLGDSIKGFWDSLTVNLQAQIDVQVKNLSDLIAFVSGSIQLVFNAATNTIEWLGVQADNAITLAQNVAGDLSRTAG